MIHYNVCYEWCNAMRMIFCYIYDYIFWYMLNNDNGHTCWKTYNWNDNMKWLWPMKCNYDIYIYGEWHECALAIECLTFVYDDDSVMSYNDI